MNIILNYVLIQLLLLVSGVQRFSVKVSNWIKVSIRGKHSLLTRLLIHNTDGRNEPAGNLVM